MDPELSRKYRAELARLDAEYAHYEQQWSKVPRFAWVALSVPAAAFVWGFGAAVVALLVSAALVGTRAYLIAMRKGEIRWMHTRLLDDVNAYEAGGATKQGQETRTQPEQGRSPSRPAAAVRYASPG